MCLNNLDIEEQVHNHTIGNQTNNFQGTWGYVHLPSPDLIGFLDWDKINLQKFKEAMQKFLSMSIQPQMFMPMQDLDKH